MNTPSSFSAHLSTGEVLQENWNDFCQEKTVGYFGGQKRVRVSKHPLKTIEARHGELHTEIEVPRGCEAYQAIRAHTVFTAQGPHTEIVGRVIGIVKNGEVIEEQFLNGIAGEIVGVRK